MESGKWKVDQGPTFLNMYHSYAVTINPTDGTSPDMEELILNYLQVKLNCFTVHCIEFASQRHMHLGVLSTSKSIAKCLRNLLTKRYGDQFKHPLVAVKCKTWYKSDGGQKDTSWIDYLTKDGPATWSDGFPEEFEEYLSDHVDPAKRQQAAWPQMNHYLQLFNNNNLPTETFDDISTGLATLAYDLKVASLPRASDIPGLIFNLNAYANNFNGGLLRAMHKFTAENQLKRKTIESDLADDLTREKRAKLTFTGEDNPTCGLEGD